VTDDNAHKLLPTTGSLHVVNDRYEEVDSAAHFAPDTASASGEEIYVAIDQIGYIGLLVSGFFRELALVCLCA
jgi:hypothetical protein